MVMVSTPVMKATKSSLQQAAADAPKRSIWERSVSKLRKQKQVLICFGIIGVYLLIALLGYINLLPDFQQRLAESYAKPSLSSFAMIWGADVFGRSILYKVLAGAQTAITLGFIVTIITVPIGVIMGALSGFYGKKIDTFIVWLYSVIVSLPGVLLLVAISYTLGKGLFAVCIALSATSWVGLCRMIRGEFMKHKEREYVLSSRLVGASDLLIIFRHILPNVVHLAIVSASLLVLESIKAEVMLTFLGVGIQSGASWGTMINDAPGELTNGIWWPLASVVCAMFLIIYALNVVGDAMRDALDPKLLD